MAKTAGNPNSSSTPDSARRQRRGERRSRFFRAEPISWSPKRPGPKQHDLLPQARIPAPAVEPPSPDRIVAYLTDIFRISGQHAFDLVGSGSHGFAIRRQPNGREVLLGRRLPYHGPHQVAPRSLRISAKDRPPCSWRKRSISSSENGDRRFAGGAGWKWPSVWPASSQTSRTVVVLRNLSRMAASTIKRVMGLPSSIMVHHTCGELYRARRCREHRRIGILGPPGRFSWSVCPRFLTLLFPPLFPSPLCHCGSVMLPPVACPAAAIDSRSPTLLWIIKTIPRCQAGRRLRQSAALDAERGGPG